MWSSVYKEFKTHQVHGQTVTERKNMKILDGMWQVE